jgi:hypothetical protein
MDDGVGTEQRKPRHRKRKEGGPWRKMSKKARKEYNAMKEEGGAIGGAVLEGMTDMSPAVQPAPSRAVLALEAPGLVQRRARKSAWRRRLRKVGILPVSRARRVREQRKELEQTPDDVRERWEAVLTETAGVRRKLEERGLGAAEAMERISAALRVVRKRRSSLKQCAEGSEITEGVGGMRKRKRGDGSGDIVGSRSAAGGRVAKKRKGNQQRMLQLIRSNPNQFANPKGCPIRKYLQERVDDWWLTDAQRPARLATLKQERKERLAIKREAQERRRLAWERMEDQRVRIGQYTGVPAGGGPGNKVVGKPVEKQFGRHFYKGVVKMYVPDEQWYLVGLRTL